MTSLRFALLTLGLAATALLALLASGIGYQQRAWSLSTAFTMIRWAAYAGIATGVLATVGTLTARPVGRRTLVFAVAAVLAAVTAVVPWRWKQIASSVPPIHDITTDTENPPPFVAVLPLRANAKNSAEYAGDSVAALQRAGYPDLAPAMLPQPVGETFARARAAVTAMGMELVAADSADGRLEATATTTWFGFKDDVVVRVRSAGSGSRVDVRSVSRLGGSDVGTNAARIRDFLARL
ncbi:DUF1499 domain-containing protein [Gemmatimonas sp.]|uniref:DUF1499 domain-containing protein n=1 Tax=Gemmatimonas sp. TaxID=1962908 RepID=UPI00398363A7